MAGWRVGLLSPKWFFFFLFFLNKRSYLPKNTYRFLFCFSYPNKLLQHKMSCLLICSRSSHLRVIYDRLGLFCGSHRRVGRRSTGEAQKHRVRKQTWRRRVQDGYRMGANCPLGSMIDSSANPIVVDARDGGCSKSGVLFATSGCIYAISPANVRNRCGW